MKTNYLFLSLLLLTFTSFAQPANDGCTSSVNIIVTSNTKTFNFVINGATVNNEVDCDGATAADYVDVWYDFTMPFNGSVYINAKIGWNNIALYDACAGTQIDCASGGKFIRGLTSGANYKLRVFRTAANAGNNYTDFTIKAFEDAANNDCTSSQNIAVSTSNTTIDFEIGGSSVVNQIGCEGTTAADYVDLWYDFNMPFNGNVYINAKIGWNNIALYDACAGTQIDCASGSKFISGLTSGTNYKLRIFRTAANAANNYLDFSIIAYEEAANDTCATSQNIPISTTTSTIDFVIGGAASNTEVGCEGATALDLIDIWYDFTMPFNGNVYINAKIGWNNIALYDACAGTQIDCASGSKFITGLTSGVNYKLRIFRTAANANNNYTDFTIKAFESAANNDCTSSQNITVSATNNTIDFEIGGSTIENQIGCEGTTAADFVDLWYDFNMPFNGNVYVNASIGWNNIALYDACAGTQLKCGSGSSFITELTSGTNYKLRIFRTAANAPNNYLDFSIIAFPETTNDECASAETITVTTDQSTINFNIGGASVNNEVGCEATTATNYVDVWYDITMPVNGNLHVDAIIGWSSIALYDSCGGTQIQCGNDNQLFTGLTFGTNYKLRIFRTEDLADDIFQYFYIQAFEIINNDDCASAENITVTNTPTTVNFGIGGATINNEVGCSGTTAADYADIWYDFTMPVNGRIIIDGIISWNNFALYNACGGSQLGCFSGVGNFAELTSGETYKLRVFRTLANTDFSYKSFTISYSTTLSTDAITLDKKINIYPNPANNFINIESVIPVKHIDVFDVMGKKVLHVKETKQININALNAGLYIIEINTNDGELSKKIIKI